MSATILLKSGVTDPHVGTLMQSELGVNKNTDDLFLGTQSGRAKKMASVDWVNFILDGFVDKYNSTITSLELSSDYCGILILKISNSSVPYFICVDEGTANINPLISYHSQESKINISADALTLNISVSDNFNYTLITFTGNYTSTGSEV